MPGFIFAEEDDVPFADAEVTAANGLDLADDGRLHPVPLSCDDDDFKPSLERPGAADLEWITAALPAVTTFTQKHAAVLTRYQGGPERALLTAPLTHIHGEGGSAITVCFPPPSAEWMPDRPDLELRAEITSEIPID